MLLAHQVQVDLTCAFASVPYRTLCSPINRGQGASPIGRPVGRDKCSARARHDGVDLSLIPEKVIPDDKTDSRRSCGPGDGLPQPSQAAMDALVLDVCAERCFR